MISKIIPLNNSWEFTSHCTYAFLDGTEACGSVVRLPHTTRVTPFDYFDETDYQMDCAYRRYLKLDLREDQRVFLRLGAAGHHAEVWLDGKKISEHDCGYTAFETELTGEEWFRSDDLANDVHLLAIRVDSREDRNIPPFGHVIDYMTFGGLYREAELVITESSRISDVWDRFIQ